MRINAIYSQMNVDTYDRDLSRFVSVVYKNAMPTDKH